MIKKFFHIIITVLVGLISTQTNLYANEFSTSENSYEINNELNGNSFSSLNIETRQNQHFSNHNQNDPDTSESDFTEEEDNKKNIFKKLLNPNHNLFRQFSTIKQWCFFIPKYKRHSFSSHLTQFSSRKIYAVFQVIRI